MTTIVTTFYDALVAKMLATFPSAKHIANASDLESAPTLFLQDGYAIAVGPSSGSESDQSNQERFTRDFLIIRTKLVSATENNATAMATSVKDLLEGHYTLRAALRTDNTLSGAVADIRFISDGGIEQIATLNDAGRFHVLSSLYQVTYIENLY